jgi:hypothetical protein
MGNMNWNLSSTNDQGGWLMYYAMHLFFEAGVTDLKELIMSITSSTSRVFRAKITGETLQLSDLECVMLTNNWFYWWFQGDGWLMGSGKAMSRELFWGEFKRQLEKKGCILVAALPE